MDQYEVERARFEEASSALRKQAAGYRLKLISNQVELRSSDAEPEPASLDSSQLIHRDLIEQETDIYMRLIKDLEELAGVYDSIAVLCGFKESDHQKRKAMKRSSADRGAGRS